MFDFQLAPFIIAGLVTVSGYLLVRWLAVADIARHWKAIANSLVDNIEEMQREGCAAADLVQNIFNGLTSPAAIDGGVSLQVQGEMASACGILLLDAARCDHKDEVDELREALVYEEARGDHTIMRAENWERIADRLADEQIATKQDIVLAQARAEEAERLLGLASDRLAAKKSYDTLADLMLQ